jgi:hypothetical protein
VIGSNIGVRIKNCKRKLNSTEKIVIPVRYFTYVRNEPNYLIGKLGRFLIDMH